MFYEWLTAKFDNPNFLNQIVIGDKASFGINGKVNAGNVVQYAPLRENPGLPSKYLGHVKK